MSENKTKNAPLVISGFEVAPGTRERIELELPRLYTHTPMHMPVHVVRGRKPGPRLLVSAAIHGDELNGVEIIRRVLRHSALRRLRGSLVAIPMVNVYGIIHHSRYLPDRRDLNRSFPGSAKGSLASRVAHLFMEEVVSRCTHGIDLHTGALHRTNLPQIRGALDNPETVRLAKAFGVPVLLHAALRDGSLREAAADCGVPMLLYEAGEALRFDELSIRAGVRGVLNVMRALSMLPAVRRKGTEQMTEPFIARSSRWTRAPASGIVHSHVALGDRVQEGQALGVITHPHGAGPVEIPSRSRGIVIGKSQIPLVHEGEALFHIAQFEDGGVVAEHVDLFQSLVDD